MVNRIYQVWLRVSKRIGNFQARLILTIFYFVFLPVFAIAGKILHKMSSRHEKTQSTWIHKERKEAKLPDLRNQY